MLKNVNTISVSLIFLIPVNIRNRKNIITEKKDLFNNSFSFYHIISHTVTASVLVTLLPYLNEMFKNIVVIIRISV